MTLHRNHLRRTGFTLTELLISVALALVVLYGVNKVFSTTATTIGVGNALRTANNTLRAVENNLNSDFNPQVDVSGTEIAGTGILPAVPTAARPTIAQPAIAIRCEAMYAFMSKADEDANNGNAANQWDPTQSGTFSTVPAGLLSARYHRKDTVSFFTESNTTNGAAGFRRQTGQNLNGRETLVTDLSKPLDYAWVWYGHAMLPDNPTGADFAAMNFNQPGAGTVNFYASNWVLARKAILIFPREVTPPIVAGSGGGYVYDSSGAPMYFYRDTKAADLSPIGYGSPAYRSDDGVYDNDVADSGDSAAIQSSIYDVAGIEGGIGNAQILTDPGIYKKMNDNLATQWAQLVEDGTGQAYRFNAIDTFSPPTTGLPSSQKAALSSSVLAQGCTQFIVEFAGDITTLDGKIDTTGANPDAIQWYGLPRDTDGDGTADVVMPAGAFVRSSTANVANFVWGPAELKAGPRPSLIRITVRVVDANNRLQDGLTREFIYRVR